jgi:hypothetical protein
MKPTLVQALLIVKARGATKVRMADAHQILGTAELAAPQWIPLDNYEVKLPESYVASILADSKQLGRFVRSAMQATRFGKFITQDGQPTDLDGLIYQYTMIRSPITTRWGYQLFSCGQPVSKNAEMPSDQHARAECFKAAQQLAETMFPQEDRPHLGEPEAGEPVETPTPDRSPEATPDQPSTETEDA